MADSTLKAAIISAFRDAWLPAVGGGVTVVNGSNSTQGVPNDRQEVDMGEEMDAPVTGIVRVEQDAIGTVEVDQTITVGGKRVMIQWIDKDKAGALVTIAYSEARPVQVSML